MLSFLRSSSKRDEPQKLPAGATRQAIRELIDVTAIQDTPSGALIQRKDGWYAMIIEVEGEAFALMTDDEQDLRIEAYGQVLNGLPDGWQIQVTRLAEPTNLDPLMQSLDTVVQREKGTPLGRLAEAWQDVTDLLAATIVHHTTVITVWDRHQESTIEKARHVLAGLLDAQFQAKICNADRVAVILQLAYGQVPVPIDAILPQHGLNEGLKQRMGASDASSSAPPTAAAPRRGRPNASPSDSAAVSLAAPTSPPVLKGKLPGLRDVIEPGAVIEMPGQLDLGGVYAATLVVRTWPELVRNGWLEWLYGADSDDTTIRRRVSFYIESLPTSRVLTDLQRRQVQLDAETWWARRRGLREDIGIELGREAIDILREELGRGRQKMFLVQIVVTLLADTPEQLRVAVRNLIRRGAGYQIVLRPLYLEELLGFRATVPLGMQPIAGLPDRGVPTVALATTFPFSAGELMDPVGDVWGENRSTGGLIVLDPAQFDLRHMMVVAKSRSGKSTAVKVLATQALFRPDEAVIVIDPSPPIDYERWTRWLRGAYVRFGPGSSDGINPFDIVVPESMARVRDTDMASPIREKVAFGVELIGLMAQRALSPTERLALEEVFLQQFAAHGMAVPESASPELEWQVVLDRDPMRPQVAPRAKPSPTLTELWQAMQTHDALQDVAIQIRPFVTGIFNMFAGQTTVDMSQRLVVFNVHSLIQGSAGEYHQAVVYAMIAEFVRWQLARARRRTFVIVDEGHIMFRRKDTAQFVSQLFRMAAKQGGRVALLTQGIVDIMGDPATGVSVPGEADARFCLENTGFKLLLRNDNDADLDLIARSLGITPSEGREIKSAKRGRGVILVTDPRRGTHRAFVEIFVPRLLYPWVTSDPAEVEEFRRQGIYDEIEVVPTQATDAPPVQDWPANAAAPADVVAVKEVSS